MGVLLVIVSLMLACVKSEILEAEVLKKKLLYYMPLLHAERIPMERIGLDFLRYGYVNSNCGDRKGEVEIENNLFMDKRDQDVQVVLSKFYEFYILPFGDYDGTLWNLLLSFPSDYNVLSAQDGAYDMLQYRGCDQRATNCHRYLPMRPANLHFTPTQCSFLQLYIGEFYYRTETFALPVDYYALNIYVLSKLDLPTKSLGFQKQEEKLFEMKYFLTFYLKKNRGDYERKFINYLIYRTKRQELIQKDLDGCADADRRRNIEEELKFQKMVTNMMVQGWMINEGSTATDGKYEFTDLQGKKYVYDVPPITDFDSTKHV